MNPVPVEHLEILNSWPEGTVGHGIDAVLINHVNSLCIQHGYGRMGQLMGALEEIWRNPEEAVPKWKAFHDGRMEGLKETMAHYQGQQFAPDSGPKD